MVKKNENLITLRNIFNKFFFFTIISSAKSADLTMKIFFVS